MSIEAAGPERTKRDNSFLDRNGPKDAKQGFNPAHAPIPEDCWATFSDLGSDDEDSIINWQVPKILTKPLEKPLRSALKGRDKSPRPASPAQSPAAKSAEANDSGDSRGKSLRTSKQPAMVKDRSANSFTSWTSKASASVEHSTIVFDDAPAEVLVYTPEPSFDNLLPEGRGSNTSDLEANWEAIQARFSAWSEAILADDYENKRRMSDGVRNSTSSTASYLQGMQMTQVQPKP